MKYFYYISYHSGNISSFQKQLNVWCRSIYSNYRQQRESLFQRLHFKCHSCLISLVFEFRFFIRFYRRVSVVIILIIESILTLLFDYLSANYICCQLCIYFNCGINKKREYIILSVTYIIFFCYISYYARSHFHKWLNIC